MYTDASIMHICQYFFSQDILRDYQDQVSVGQKSNASSPVLN